MIQRTVELDPIRWHRLIRKLDEAHESGLADYEDASAIDAAEYWTGGDWLAKRSYLYGTLVIYRPETRDSATTYIQRRDWYHN